MTGTVADALPKTAEALQAWSGTEIPSIATFEILGEELTTARETRELGRIASRVNRISSGSRSTISRTARRLEREDAPDMRAAFIGIDEDWGELEIWHAFQQATTKFSSRNFLQAIDLRLQPDGSIERMPESQRVYVTLFIRTLGVSIAVTLLCFLIGYPMAYAMAHAGPGWARLLLVMVLIPFWTSLLVQDHFVDCDPATTGGAQRHFRVSWYWCPTTTV